MKYALRVFNGCIICFILSMQSRLLHADTILVSAASSLSPSLLAIKMAFEKSTSHQVIYNFASSSVLARQIEHGIDSTLYLSANKKWVRYLLSKKKLIPSSVKTIMTNKLVLVTSIYKNKSNLTHFSKSNSSDNNGFIDNSFQKNILTIKSLNSSIVVADPSHVPLGEYTKQALEHIELFSMLSPQFVPVSNARSALAFVERGQSDFAILYKTDAIASSQVEILQTIPLSFHEPIAYYLAKNCCQQQGKYSASNEFYNFLLSEKAQLIFKQYGFGNTNGIHKQKEWIEN